MRVGRIFAVSTQTSEGFGYNHDAALVVTRSSLCWRKGKDLERIKLQRGKVADISAEEQQTALAFGV